MSKLGGHGAPITRSEIRDYVKRMAAKRRGEFAYIYSAKKLTIGCSNEEGMWDLFVCDVVESEGGYEPRTKKPCRKGHGAKRPRKAS